MAIFENSRLPFRYTAISPDLCIVKHSDYEQRYFDFYDFSAAGDDLAFMRGA